MKILFDPAIHESKEQFDMICAARKWHKYNAQFLKSNFMNQDKPFKQREAARKVYDTAKLAYELSKK